LELESGLALFWRARSGFRVGVPFLWDERLLESLALRKVAGGAFDELLAYIAGILGDE
jgi:hypothetical protein